MKKRMEYLVLSLCFIGYCIEATTAKNGIVSQ